MLTINELQDGREYWLVCNNGKRYKGTYTEKYGGVVFTAIPAELNVIGYEDVRTEAMEYVRQQFRDCIYQTGTMPSQYDWVRFLQCDEFTGKFGKGWNVADIINELLMA